MKARQLLLVFLPGLERYASKYFEIFLIIPLSTTILSVNRHCVRKNNYERLSFFENLSLKCLPF